MTVVAGRDLRSGLEATSLPGAAELSAALQELCGRADPPPRLVSLHKLKTSVYRIRIGSGPGEAVRSFVLKSCNPGLARHNLLVARRWLPLLGLADAAARLEGTAADPQGRRIWLIHEDLGDDRLDGHQADRDRIAAAVDLIAALHTRSAEHPVLPDCRAQGGDLGAGYLTANVRDAVRALDQLGPPRATLSPAQQHVRDRLLLRLRQLRDELPARVHLLEQEGGPEVLLHGDPWTSNVFVTQTNGAYRASLVDWDHAGVGRAGYDLSIFLLRFPAEERPWILERYRSAVCGGWPQPGTRELNVQLETAEFARYANRAIWPAVAWLVDGADWAAEELAMVAGWFDDWKPVL